MATPYTLDNTFRVYDQAIYAWLDGLKVSYDSLGGVPRTSFGILRCFATPKRALSRMADLLVRKGWLDTVTPGSGNGTAQTGVDTYERVPLPFVSITQMDPMMDPMRFGRSEVRSLTRDPDVRVAYNHEFPKAVNIPYQLDFWVKKNFTRNHIYEWLYSQVGSYGKGQNELFLNVNIGNGWGTKHIPLTVEGVSNGSDYEPGDSDRSIRIIVDLLLHAWLFMPPKTSKLVHTVIYEIVDMDSGDFISGDTLHKYNMTIPENWTLVNTSGNSVFETEEKQLTYTPGAPTDYVTSPYFPSYPETYRIQGEYTSRNSWELIIYAKDGTEILHQTLSASKNTIGFRFEFVNLGSNPTFKVIFKSSDEVILTNVQTVRMTYTV